MKSARQEAPERVDPQQPVLIDRSPAERQNSSRFGEKNPSLPEMERLAYWMDSAFQIPGLGFSFGLDAILGLMPGFGDTATSLVSLYILHAAGRRGVSRLTMTRMAANIALDYALGAIPLVGDVFDVYWKSNQKNVELLRRATLTGPADRRRLNFGDWAFFAGLMAILMTLLVGSVTIAWFVIAWLGSLLVSGGT